MVTAEVNIAGIGRATRRLDAIRSDSQVHSSNALAPDLTVVRFYRGGVSYIIRPSTRSAVLDMARDFCRMAQNDPSVISVRAAKGALMPDELPPVTDCKTL